MSDELLIKYITGNATREEILQVKEWVRASKNIEKELLRLKNIWIFSGLENEISEKRKEAEIERILRIVRNLKAKQQKNAFRRKIFRYAAIAVVLIGLSGLGGYFIAQRRSLSYFNGTEIIVCRGERSTVLLPDGSMIKLNSDSRLKLASDFRSGNRTIDLQGEAFFKVAHDSRHPFTVKTGGLNVQVLGTVFNVSNYPGDSLITTFLQSGKVKISTEFSDNVILNPKEAYSYNRVTHESSKTKMQDLRMTDWTKGILTIDGEKIGELAKKLERRFDVNIAFGDKEVADHVYTGSIKDEDINTVLAALEFASSIRYERNGNKITLYSRQKK